MSQQAPEGMEVLLQQFLEWLAIKNYTEQTIETRRWHLRWFLDWLALRGITQANEVSKPVVERYQRFLFNYRKKNGEPLNFRVQNNRLVAVRAWFKWLAKRNHILYNPAADLELARLEHRLPKCVLTAKEAELVLNQTNTSTPKGIRDRAILETFYSTGIRRFELIGLRVYDLDIERGTILVHQGKGKKDRMLPIGERALAWITRYLTEVRPSLLVADKSGDTLFLSHLGEPLEKRYLSSLVKDYVEAADMGKKGSCHLLRHTMATLMFENGCDIRFIQEMLGHSRLDTTQIYTRVGIRQLKEIHSKTHPARLKRTE